MIGRSTGNCAPNRQNQQAYNGGYRQPYQQGYPAQPAYDPAYEPQPGYRGEYPLEGGPGYNNSGYPDRGYNNGGYRNAGGYQDPKCRWGEVTTRDHRGRPVTEQVYICRGRDGIWRPQ